jgi:hypothetical protein
LQSWSTPSQLASLAAGVPGVQLLLGAPLTQVSWPVATHEPTPQVVVVAT